jgi:hypothetical protein
VSSSRLYILTNHWIFETIANKNEGYKAPFMIRAEKLHSDLKEFFGFLPTNYWTNSDFIVK